MSSWIECNKTLLMTQLDKEKKTFYLICLYHIIVWTILPFLANKNLPLDTIEALAWGGSFDLGYNKHPPLSAWIPGLLFKFFGNKDFIYYLLSQLFIVLALIYVRKIAKIFLKKKISITLSFLILESIAFFNFETPQFNVNICQIPFWIMTIYFFWQGIEKNKFIDWFFLGIVSALGLLTKYIFVYLLISLFIYFIYYFFLKNKKNYNFVISISILILIITPHFAWLINNDYTTIHYALKRASINEFHLLNNFINPLKFLIKQSVILSLFLLSLLILKINFKKKIIYNKKFIFLSTATILPLILILLTSIVTGSFIKTMWMVPFYISAGIFVIFIFENQINKKNIINFNLFIILLLIAYPAAYSIRSVYFDKRVGYDGKKIAEDINKEWISLSKSELKHVGFSEWYAGNLSYHLKSRPKVFLEDNENFYKQPAIVISKGVGPSLCNKNYKNLRNIIYKKIDDHDVCFIF